MQYQIKTLQTYEHYSKRYIYNLKKIINENASYNMIIGDAEIGKTFNVELLALIDYIIYGNKFVLIRRRKIEINKKEFETFSNLILKLTRKKWNGVYYKNKSYYLCNYDKYGKKINIDNKPFCYIITLSKNNFIPVIDKLKTIIFDDFILSNKKSYIVDEPFIFFNTIYMLIKYNEDIKIFMLANQKSADCPYFEIMCKSNIINKNKINVYNENPKVVAEYIGVQSVEQ